MVYVIVCVRLFFNMQMNDFGTRFRNRQGNAHESHMLKFNCSTNVETRKCTYGFSIKLTFANSKQQTATHLMNAIITSSVCETNAMWIKLGNIDGVWESQRFCVLSFGFGKTNECTCTVDKRVYDIRESWWIQCARENFRGWCKWSYIIWYRTTMSMMISFSTAYGQSVYIDPAICLPYFVCVCVCMCIVLILDWNRVPNIVEYCVWHFTQLFNQCEANLFAIKSWYDFGIRCDSLCFQHYW